MRLPLIRRTAPSPLGALPRQQGNASPLGGTQAGQIVPFFALTLSALLLMLGLVVDLGYSFHVQRMLQSAADAGAQAAVAVLASENGASTNTNQAVYRAIAAAVALNQPEGNQVTITASYISYSSASGTTSTLQPVCSSWTSTLCTDTTAPPPTATGVRVAVAQGHQTYFAQIGGLLHIDESASAVDTTLLCNNGCFHGLKNSIVALNRYNGHTILDNGAGTLVINGSVIDDSNAKADSVDSFQTSNLVVQGTIVAVSPHPPDNAFNCPTGSTTWCTPTTIPAAATNPPAGTTYTCAQRGTNPSVECWQNMISGASYTPDPYLSLTQPTWSQAAAQSCTGGYTATNKITYNSGVYTVQNGSFAGSGQTLAPGVYVSSAGATSLVSLSGNLTLGDCNGSPGIYYFPGGVNFSTAAGQTISVSDSVIFATEQQSATSSALTDKKANGIYIGGAGGTFTQTSPGRGPFMHMALWQDRNAPLAGSNTNPSTAALAFNTVSGDAATITIYGAVYAHDYYDDYNNGGTPGNATDVAYFGEGSAGATTGTVTIQGTLVADYFVTAGSTVVNVNFDQTWLPPSNSTGIICC